MAFGGGDAGAGILQIATPQHARTIATVTPAVDAAVILAAGQISPPLYTMLTGSTVSSSVYLGASILLAPCFTSLLRARNLYGRVGALALDQQLRGVTFSWLISFGLLLALAFLMKASADLSRGSCVVFAAVGLVGLLVHRVALRFALARALARGTMPRRRAALLATRAFGAGSPEVRSLRASGFDVAEQVVIEAGDDRDAALARLVERVRGSSIEEIIVATGTDELRDLDGIVDVLRCIPLPVSLLPDTTLSRLFLQPSRAAGDHALVAIKREPLGRTDLLMKRALDVAVAGTALLLLAPLLVVAIAAIKLDTPGTVLFRQSRRGFNGRTFKILKLRTMRVLEDGARIEQARRGDPRVTRVGYWLRRTSIDELPQLWNVLRGEMSVIGPRPHAVAHDNYYDALIENYAHRQHVKPGLTGWAQVNGYRGETPDIGAMAARIDRDLWYINNWSIMLDLRVLLLTSVRLFSKTAY